MHTYIVLVGVDGLNIPVEEWQKAIKEQLQKVNKLEADYEADMLSQKVRAHSRVPGYVRQYMGP